MRYGLLALSMAMLTSGGVAAQSALAISYSAEAKMREATQTSATSARFGSLPPTPTPHGYSANALN